MVLRLTPASGPPSARSRAFGLGSEGGLWEMPQDLEQTLVAKAPAFGLSPEQVRTIRAELNPT